MIQRFIETETKFNIDSVQFRMLPEIQILLVMVNKLDYYIISNQFDFSLSTPYLCPCANIRLQ